MPFRQVYVGLKGHWHFHRSIYIGVGVFVHLYVCKCIHPNLCVYGGMFIHLWDICGLLGHPCVCQYLHMSGIHMSICLFIHPYICPNVSDVQVCLYVHNLHLNHHYSLIWLRAPIPIWSLQLQLGKVAWLRNTRCCRFKHWVAAPSTASSREPHAS